MKALVFGALLCGAAGAAAPADWAGDWFGACTVTPAYQGIESFRAKLNIGPQSAEGRLRWKITYELAQRDVRDYQLVPVDAAKGHYAVDEKNGLLLDAFLADGVLYMPFTIGGTLITATYSVGADGVMVMNLPSFGSTPVRTTCLTREKQTCAQSFALTGTQHCRLEKAN